MKLDIFTHVNVHVSILHFETTQSNCVICKKKLTQIKVSLIFLHFLIFKELNYFLCFLELNILLKSLMGFYSWLVPFVQG